MFRSALRHLTLAAAWLAFASSHAQQPAAEDHAAHAAAAASGLKKDLFAGITENDFMKLGDKPKTVKVILVATFTDVNYGMNFNGYFKGNATFTVPVGWTVDVEFINPSAVPHSAIIVEKDELKKLQIPTPYFKGGAVEKHLQGIAFAKASFSFNASEAGEYAFACGFPAHALAGHWVAFNVDDKATAPSIKLGDKPARELK
jgi:plastocyanin